jgi:hypothetical protein
VESTTRRILRLVVVPIVALLICACESTGYGCPPVEGNRGNPTAGAQPMASVDPCPPGTSDGSMTGTVYVLTAPAAGPGVTTAIQRRFAAPDVKGLPVSVPLRCGAATGAPSDWGLRHLRWEDAHGDPWHRDPFRDHGFEAEIIRTLESSTAQVQASGNTLLVVVRYSSQKQSCYSNNPWGFAVVVGLNDRGFGDQHPVGIITAYWIDPEGNMAPPKWWNPKL